MNMLRQVCIKYFIQDPSPLNVHLIIHISWKLTSPLDNKDEGAGTGT